MTKYKSSPSSVARIFLLALAVAHSISKVHIWEPKSLKAMYAGHDIQYSVMNFGVVPYGHSIYGTVFKASPIDACSELAPLKWDKNYGTLILLLERGGCNFSEKVFNAQKIGAGLVLIADNNVENVHKIFPVERTKEMLDRIHIPSILISKEDGDNIKAAIDAPNGSRPHEGASSGLVELAIHFNLIKVHNQANIRIILQVDDYRSYDLITEFMSYYKKFSPIINLQVHFKIFMNTEVGLDGEDCISIDKDKFCVAKSFGNTKSDLSLINETVRQLCLNRLDRNAFVEYAKAVRANCFGADRQVTDDFHACTERQWASYVSLDQQNRMASCLTLDSTDNKSALMANHEETKYFMINYSPLIFINGYYYKGNFDDLGHLFEAICNGFEVSPPVCYTLDAFVRSEDLNSTSLGRFVMITFGVCVAMVTLALVLFYIVYKKKMKKQFTFELKGKINEALALYYSDAEERMEQEGASPASPTPADPPKADQAPASDN
jgi:hypothetical protein